MKKLFLLLIVFIIPFSGFTHSGKAKYHVIIDTDCAPDDLRAITYMLASHDFEVIAITTSDGLLHPDEGYIKIKSLLAEYNHEGIPVAFGKTINKTDSQCHGLCKSVVWGDTSDIVLPEKPGAEELLKKSLIHEDEPVYIVCMGPLTNIQTITDGQVVNKDDKIVWYCSDYKNKQGTNYLMDKQSADKVTQSGVNMFIVSNNNEDGFNFDMEFLDKVTGFDNKYSKGIKSSYNNKGVQNRINSGFYSLWDDLLPVYMQNPDLFVKNNVGGNITTIVPSKDSGESVKRRIAEVMNLKDNNENKVFSSFPENPKLYKDDVSPYVQETISKYGISEWRAVTITNELHGHLGIYSVVGAKMGIRVREYFAIGLDDLIVVSYTGKTPPLSCMNDGLQVSTGATIGHGLIEISDTGDKGPYADFTFKNNKIRVYLKESYRKQVVSDIRKGIADYGNLTPEYWEFVRKLAIQYWIEWSRDEMFIIEVM